MLDVPGDVAPKMIDGKGNLLPEYAARGMRLERATELAVTFAYFNMEDPVVGGYTPEKIALRRAICSAYNLPDEIRVIRNGQALPATQPLPPDVEGHVRGYKGLSPYDPATARALLDKFGYRDRDGDGFRELPDGRPLTIRQITLCRRRVPAVRRPVAAKHARGRHPHGFPGSDVPGGAQGRARGPDPVLELRLERRHRRRLHASFLRTLRRRRQPARDSRMPSTTRSTRRAAARPTPRNATSSTKR